MAFTRDNKIQTSIVIEDKPTVAIVKNNNCTRCGDLIYPTELMGQIMGLKYHRNCFRCFVCDRNLELKTYMTNTIDLNDKQIYCSTHAPKSGKHHVPYVGPTGRSRSPAVSINSNSPKTTHVRRYLIQISKNFNSKISN